MSKERLQDIKKKYNYERLGEFIDVKPVNPYELKWLIEQAERVEELEEEVDRLNGALHYQLSQENIRNEENRKLKYKNKRYREALKNILEDLDLNTMTVVNRDNFNWLIEQAGRVQELEKRIKELEYASKYNGKLNEFLQKRKLPPNILGSHVVEVVMDYVEELEQQNKRYRKVINNINEKAMLYGVDEEVYEAIKEAIRALEESE